MKAAVRIFVVIIVSLLIFCIGHLLVINDDLETQIEFQTVNLDTYEVLINLKNKEIKKQENRILFLESEFQAKKKENDEFKLILLDSLKLTKSMIHISNCTDCCNSTIASKILILKPKLLEFKTVLETRLE